MVVYSYLCVSLQTALAVEKCQELMIVLVLQVNGKAGEPQWGVHFAGAEHQAQLQAASHALKCLLG